MTDKKDFLIEIGTEELPPKALSKLSDAFTDGIITRVKQAGLMFDSFKSFATPRRLALTISALEVTQQDQEIDRKGPALKAAYDKDGNPSKAAEGFARSCGTTVDKLDKLETDKGSWLFYKLLQKGKQAEEILPAIIQESLDGLPIPKKMRWGDNTVEFVRPVHWILALLGEKILETTILGIKSSNKTKGHRFHSSGEMVISTPAEYEDVLKSKGFVIADFSKRKQVINDLVIAAAEKNNGVAVIDVDLLSEVTGLVEWPVPIVGEFEKEFLDVPQEALISSMQDHQKYFPIVDVEHKLRQYFITISNIDTSNPEVVKAGNERVIRPRLADAAFFWNQDKKSKLESYSEKLKKVVFQNKLGSVYEKMERVANIAEKIATDLNIDAKCAKRAALLSKCDLLTDMVGEFPDLQGIMGRYYALNDDEDVSVASAVEQHYLPKFAGDSLPESDISSAVALADRMDTLAGIFGIGQLPTGDKDPFALRRAALGIIRILTEKKYDLNIQELLKVAIEQIPGDIDRDKTFDNVLSFVMDRLKGYYLEKGISANVFEAVLRSNPSQMTDFENRIVACVEFSKNPASTSLAAANKRIGNILKKVKVEIPTNVEVELLTESAEITLHSEIENMSAVVTPLLSERKYIEAFSELAKLKDVVDQFFDNVMVMAEDEKAKSNRIALLNNVSEIFTQVADISIL